MRIVDRVTVNAHILNTGADSYRLRASKTRTRAKKTSRERLPTIGCRRSTPAVSDLR